MKGGGVVSEGGVGEGVELARVVFARRGGGGCG